MYHISLDKKGRIVIPSAIREKYGLEEVELREENGKIVLEPIQHIDDPIAYLASFSIKTKKSPKELKKEAQELMGRM